MDLIKTVASVKRAIQPFRALLDLEEALANIPQLQLDIANLKKQKGDLEHEVQELDMLAHTGASKQELEQMLEDLHRSMNERQSQADEEHRQILHTYEKEKERLQQDITALKNSRKAAQAAAAEADKAYNARIAELTESVSELESTMAMKTAELTAMVAGKTAEAADAQAKLDAANTALEHLRSKL